MTIEQKAQKALDKSRPSHIQFDTPEYDNGFVSGYITASKQTDEKNKRIKELEEQLSSLKASMDILVDDNEMLAKKVKEGEEWIEKERLLCAAIWYKELPLVKPEVLLIRGFAPYNVDKGIVFCGWRHPSCLYQKVAITGLKDSESGEHVQGFITSKNRFVDRKEAMQIARESGQVTKQQSFEELYSEDLY